MVVDLFHYIFCVESFSKFVLLMTIQMFQHCFCFRLMFDECVSGSVWSETFCILDSNYNHLLD